MRDRSAGPAAGEARLVLALALLAGLRVLLFAFAFPFFTNVDEYRHFDVVLKYARGHLPAPGGDRYEAELPELVARYGSPEYLLAPATPEADVPLPVWRISDADAERRIAATRAYLGARHSLEADQPPVYYASAGAWLALGRALGLEGLALLYWLRLLGAFASAALVGCAWWGLRELYPESRLVRVGVPLLLATLPLDSAYYVTGDAFSPLLGGLAFVLVLRALANASATPAAHAVAGLALAAAFLCKYPSVAVAAGAACATGLALREGILSGRGARVALLWAAFLLPAGLWLARNAWLGGGLTGTSFKVEHLGWGHKPASQWLEHPIFSPAGAWTFLRDLVPAFWRGELAWRQRDLAHAGADALYRVSSLAFVPLAALAWIRGAGTPAARRAELAALAALGAGVAVLAGLSLLFVFGETTSPSAGYPYFVQGRLISGVLLPFALLYVRGIECAAGALPRAARVPAAWSALALVVAVACVSETLLTAPVFHSAYNAFHLP